MAVHHILTDAEFSRMVFVRSATLAESTAQLEKYLDEELTRIANAGVLSQEQLAQLRTGGHDDIERWVQRAERERKEFVGRRLSAAEWTDAESILESVRCTTMKVFYRPDSTFRRAIPQESWSAVNSAPQRAAEGARKAREVAIIRNEDGEQMHVIPDAFVLHRVFGDEISPEEVASNLNRRLDEELQAIHGRCRLTDEQRRKLRLAGQGDFKAWIEKFNSIRQSATEQPVTNLQFQAIWRQLSLLEQEFRTLPIRGRSLFQKTLPHTLNEQQRTCWTDLDRDRARAVIYKVFRWTGGPIIEKDRERVIRLVHEAFPPTTLDGPFGEALLLLRLGESEREWRPIIGEQDWSTVNLPIRNTRASAEPMLREFGLWPVMLADAVENEQG